MSKQELLEAELKATAEFAAMDDYEDASSTNAADKSAADAGLNRVMSRSEIKGACDLRMSASTSAGRKGKRSMRRDNKGTGVSGPAHRLRGPSSIHKGSEHRSGVLRES